MLRPVIIETGPIDTLRTGPPAHLRVTEEDIFRSKAIGNKRKIGTLKSSDNRNVPNGKKQKTGEKQKDSKDGRTRTGSQSEPMLSTRLE